MRLRSCRALALAVLVLGGLFGASLEGCEDDCVGDAADGGCSLEACCSCCVHARVHAPAAVKLSPHRPRGPTLPGPGRVVRPAPDPRDILHVPKPRPLA